MRRQQPVRSSSAGFTLIELMVALVVSGIVAGVVFDLILGQTRFARYQNAREEVQQNARAALEVISAELRGVPPSAILTWEANKIQFRLPRAWGILCNQVTQATTTVSVRFPAGLFPADFPTTSPVPSNWGIAVGDTADIVTQTPARWSYVTGIGAPTPANCDGAGALQPTVPGGQGYDRTFTGAAFIPGDGTWASVPIGTPVFVWQEIGYDLSTSSVPGIWIRRNTQTNPQPMAGPVPAVSGVDAGLQFTYFNTTGGPPVIVDSIGRIRVTVTTVSRAKFSDIPQKQTATTEVYLRNPK